MCIFVTAISFCAGHYIKVLLLIYVSFHSKIIIIIIIKKKLKKKNIYIYNSNIRLLINVMFCVFFLLPQLEIPLN